MKILPLLLLIITCNIKTIMAQEDVNLSQTDSEKFIKVSIIEKSTELLTNISHIYLLEATNLTDNDLPINIIAQNRNNIMQQKSIVALNQTLTLKSSLKNNEDNLYILPIGATIQFYLTISRTPDVKLESWNNSEIKIVDSNGILLSNILNIETYIPDPKNFR